PPTATSRAARRAARRPTARRSRTRPRPRSNAPASLPLHAAAPSCAAAHFENPQIPRSPMEITASLVKELRERTGADMMECKKALTEAGGNIDAAAEALRKSGLAKADKKADRVAAEGRVAFAQQGNRAAIVEINCETDFVGKDENFLGFCEAVANAAVGINDVEALKAATIDGRTVEEARAELIAKVGENVQVRRMVALESADTVAGYVHGGRIGVLVELKGGDAELARGLAMHVAAMNPPHNKASDVPADFLAKE